MHDSDSSELRIAAVIQARTGSSRLPGKVLRDVGGRPMLQLLLERLRRCRSVDGLAIVTSTEPADDAIERFAAMAGVRCLRGPFADVAARYQLALDALSLDAFVRITGDSPLLDPALVDRAVTLFRSAPADVVTNVFPRSFPRGQSVEVVNGAAFRRACTTMHHADHFEHVTRVFYDTPGRWRIVNFAADTPHPNIQLSVDTADDLALVAAIVDGMDRPQWTYGLVEVLDRRAAVLGLAAAS